MKLVKLVDEVRVSQWTAEAAGPPEAGPDFVREIGPIRCYGSGGYWGEAGWAGSWAVYATGGWQVVLFFGVPRIPLV